MKHINVKNKRVKANVWTLAYTCHEDSTGCRASFHVINHSKNKIEIEMRQENVEGVSETIYYNKDLPSGKGFSIIGIQMETHDKILIRTNSTGVEFTLNALEKEKEFELSFG